MKKFSSFGSFLGRIPTIMPNNLVAHSENNSGYASDNSPDEQNHYKQTYEPQCASAQDIFVANHQEKQSDVDENQSSESQDKVIFHYPQSNYDPLQEHQNNLSQSDDIAHTDCAAKSSAFAPQNTDYQELSHKAKSLWECMREHDNIVRKMK